MRILLALVLALTVSACVTTNEMPLAPNVVRLDTNTGGWGSGIAGRLISQAEASQSGQETLRRAAEVTLRNGYTHFRFDQPQMERILAQRRPAAVLHAELHGANIRRMPATSAVPARKG